MNFMIMSFLCYYSNCFMGDKDFFFIILIVFNYKIEFRIYMFLDDKNIF
jgi:hypothetical protein